MADDDALASVAASIGHTFAHIEHLRDALTHRSFANERPHLAPVDNERLEFLGDAVLGLVVSTLLFEHFPTASEGELTRRRADLVCEPALASIATDLDLGSALRLGRGEEKSGGRQKPRLLASALEACIGAVYLDAGPAEAVRVVRGLFASRILVDAPGAFDFKSRVQERIQALFGHTPTYEMLGTEGPDHNRVFHVAIVVDGRRIADGNGRSKAEAEHAAAQRALLDLDERTRTETPGG